MSGPVPKMATCHPARKHASRGLCNSCASMRNRRISHAKDPSKKKQYDAIKRKSHIKQQYGLTEDNLNDLYKEQKGLCALCQLPGKKLVIDHDHITGLVRGLLCMRCNCALGGYEIMIGNPLLASYLRNSNND